MKQFILLQITASSINIPNTAVVALSPYITKVFKYPYSTRQHISFGKNSISKFTEKPCENILLKRWIGGDIVAKFDHPIPIVINDKH